MEKLVAKEYNAEEMILKDMEQKKAYGINKYRNGTTNYFAVEDEMTIEEKIDFIDGIDNGMATYLLDLFTKYAEESKSLPKDERGNPKTVSQKAWYKRNDTRNVLSYSQYQYPRHYYWYMGTKYRTIETICPKTSPGGYTMLYTGDHVVKMWFHDLLSNLKGKEIKLFKETDVFEVKLQKVRDYARSNRESFRIKEINDISWNGKSDVTETMLDAYISAYEKLHKLIKEIGETLPGEHLE